ncbi:MAG TPA: cell wall-binding repeat-containing protein [Microbacterium sp.]|nr:cell wall-binding repeat-containing protein [Microbacterium sp.]
MSRRIPWLLAVGVAVLLTALPVAPAVAEVIETPGSISGTVTLRDGDFVGGAANAAVSLWSWNESSSDWTAAGLGAQTDAAGNYTFPTVPPGDYTLQFAVAGAPLTFLGGATDPAKAVHLDVALDAVLTGVDVTVDAYGSISASVVYQESPGGPQIPLDHGEVSFWKLDAPAGLYRPVLEGAVSVVNGAFSTPSLEAGTYGIQVLADPQSGIGSEYYVDARYWVDGIDVVVQPGEAVDLGTLVLEPRYFDVGRIAGANRFETAVEISRFIATDGERAPVVYITNAFNFPDALAAGPAAIRRGGVILSTDPTALPDVVAQRLQELDPVRVVILGDGNSVSPAVESTIRSLVPAAEVARLGAGDRYSTAELIVRDTFATTGATLALIATGRNYPDALAAGPAAGLYDVPVILVDGRGALDDRTRALLQDLGVTEAVIIGGTPSVGNQVEDDLIGELGSGAVTRLAGGDRYETASLINEYFFAESDYAFITTGTNFADALTGGPLAGALGAPLFLSPQACLPPRVIDDMLHQQVAGVWLFGGTPSLAPAVEELVSC